MNKMNLESPAEIQQIEKQLCELSLRNFVELAWPQIEPSTKFVPNWHLDAICEHLEAVTHGDIKRLLINVPFRTSKSTVCSVMWPAWTWIKKPSFRWLCGSYAEKLAIRDALKMRNLITSQWYMGKWKDKYTLKSDQNEKKRFENNKTGYRIAFSMDGGVMGEGGSGILIDDPMDRAGAHSDAERETTLTTFSEAITTRLDDPDKSSITIIMQRLEERDLAGYVLERGGYEHLMIPMEYDPARSKVTSLGWKDPRTVEGELMWPARFSRAAVEQIKREIGTYAAAGQLQQLPAPAGGGMFKRQWFRYYKDMGDYYELTYPSTNDGPMVQRRVMKKNCWMFAVADTAMTEDEANDPTAVAVVAVETNKNGEGCIFLIEMMEFRAEAPEVKKTLLSVMAKYNLLFIGVEDTLDGKHIIQQFKKAGLPIKSIKTDGKDKKFRAIPLSIDMENGLIWFKSEAPWLQSLENQMMTFPNSAHKDQVDSLAHACNAARNKDYSIPEKQVGVTVKINGQKEVIVPGTMGWETGMHEMFGPKQDSIFKKGRGENRDPVRF